MAFYDKHYGRRSYLPKGDQQDLSRLVGDLERQARGRDGRGRRVRLVDEFDVKEPPEVPRTVPDDQLSLHL
jgi:hypothetical protein